MTNRILSRFAAAALAGASMFTATAALAGEITIWCWDPNFNVAIMKEAGARYTAKHPGTTFNATQAEKARPSGVSRKGSQGDADSASRNSCWA